jgi:hypothetical protein
VNRLQRLAQPLLDEAPHPAPPVERLRERVHQRAARRRAGVGVALTASALFLGGVALSGGGAERGGSGAEPVRAGGSIPAHTAPPATGTIPPAPAPVDPPPEDIPVGPGVEVRMDPAAAPAHVTRRITFTNRTDTTFTTCGLSFQRWEGRDWDQGVSMGFLPTGETVLMAPRVNDGGFCPTGGARMVTVEPGSTVSVDVRLGAVDQPDRSHAPATLRPGAYRILRFRLEEPFLHGTFTVSG